MQYGIEPAFVAAPRSVFCAQRLRIRSQIVYTLQMADVGTLWTAAENKRRMAETVRDVARSLINGVTEASAKVGELLVNKIKDVSKVY